MHNNEDKSGFLSGGAMGAQFGGPLGFVVGAALGGFLGSKAKKKRKIAEEKILVANTKRATKIGDQVIAGLNQSKAEIAENYTRGLSTERAKYAASGKRLEGASYQRVLGAVGQQRDEALTGVATDTDKFKKSEAFKFIKQDYEYMTQSDNTLSTMQIRTEGRGSAGFYTDDQKKQLRTSVRGSKSERAGYGRIFSEYQQSITPTFEHHFYSEMKKIRHSMKVI